VYARRGLPFYFSQLYFVVPFHRRLHGIQTVSAMLREPPKDKDEALSRLRRQKASSFNPKSNSSADAELAGSGGRTGNAGTPQVASLIEQARHGADVSGVTFWWSQRSSATPRRKHEQSKSDAPSAPSAKFSPIERPLESTDDSHSDACARAPSTSSGATSWLDELDDEDNILEAWRRRRRSHSQSTSTPVPASRKSEAQIERDAERLLSELTWPPSVCNQEHSLSDSHALCKEDKRSDGADMDSAASATSQEHDSIVSHHYGTEETHGCPTTESSIIGEAEAVLLGSDALTSEERIPTLDTPEATNQGGPKDVGAKCDSHTECEEDKEHLDKDTDAKRALESSHERRRSSLLPVLEEGEEEEVEEEGALDGKQSHPSEDSRTETYWSRLHVIAEGDKECDNSVEDEEETGQVSTEEPCEIGAPNEAEIRDSDQFLCVHVENTETQGDDAGEDEIQMVPSDAQIEKHTKENECLDQMQSDARHFGDTHVSHESGNSRTDQSLMATDGEDLLNSSYIETASLSFSRQESQHIKQSPGEKVATASEFRDPDQSTLDLHNASLDFHEDENVALREQQHSSEAAQANADANTDFEANTVTEERENEKYHGSVASKVEEPVDGEESDNVAVWLKQHIASLEEQLRALDQKLSSKAQ
jgi:hypothetical protein